MFSEWRWFSQDDPRLEVSASQLGCIRGEERTHGVASQVHGCVQEFQSVSAITSRAHRLIVPSLRR